MTEQTRIPLPAEEERHSLLERAAGLLGAPGVLKPAPVPTDLVDAARRCGRQAQREPSAESPVSEPTSSRPISRLEFRSSPQSVDRMRLLEQNLVIPDGPVTALFEEFRIVKREILQSTREAQSAHSTKSQRILVCSPLPGEGKTFCATNLALAIAAEKHSEVVLVDADFAKPSILSLLGLQGEEGLMDALADPSIRIEDCVIVTDIPGLYVLPAGSRTSSDSEFLASSRTEDVFSRLTQGAPDRVIIFDSPPALAASPAAELAKYVGQVIAVCRADRTGQRALEDALSLLSICPDIKLLLNGANFSPSGRRFGAYYGYSEEGE